MQYMRDNQDDEYGIRALQDKILQIAVYIDKLCHENDIRYFLISGSALGAIRHQGFIPWDDDLDIFMRPQDYEKFRKVFQASGDKDNYYLQELAERKGRVFRAKLRLNNTTFIESAVKDWKIHHGIFVDIFLLHNAATNKFARWSQYIAAKLLCAKGQSLKQVSYRGLKRLATTVAKILPLEWLAKNAYARTYKYNNVQTPFYAHFEPSLNLGKCLYPVSYFAKAQRVPFEKVPLDVPIESDKYLRQVFGDYMKLPSKESIEHAQHAYQWDVNKDFSFYVNKDRDFSDEKKFI